MWLDLRDGAAGHADLGDDRGALWRYLGGGGAKREAVLLCPGDEGETPLGWVTSPAFPRNYSYSMNYLVCSSNDADRGGGVAFLPGIRASSVMRPAEKVMWYEELAPNDTWNLTQIDLADNPAARHGVRLRGDARLNPLSGDYLVSGRGNLCFFDGHVVLMSPQDVLDQRNRSMHRPLVETDTQ